MTISNIDKLILYILNRKEVYSITWLRLNSLIHILDQELSIIEESNINLHWVRQRNLPIAAAIEESIQKLKSYNLIKASSKQIYKHSRVSYSKAVNFPTIISPSSQAIIGRLIKEGFHSMPFSKIEYLVAKTNERVTESKRVSPL